MDFANTILIVVGAIVILFGVAGFFNPSITRWINAPGGPRLKAIIAIFVGAILVIISLIVKIPN